LSYKPIFYNPFTKYQNQHAAHLKCHAAHLISHKISCCVPNYAPDPGENNIFSRKNHDISNVMQIRKQETTPYVNHTQNTKPFQQFNTLDKDVFQIQTASAFIFCFIGSESSKELKTSSPNLTIPIGNLEHTSVNALFPNFRADNFEGKIVSKTLLDSAKLKPTLINSNHIPAQS